MKKMKLPKIETKCANQEERDYVKHNLSQWGLFRHSLHGRDEELWIGVCNTAPDYYGQYPSLTARPDRERLSVRDFLHQVEQYVKSRDAQSAGEGAKAMELPKVYYKCANGMERSLIVGALRGLGLFDGKLHAYDDKRMVFATTGKRDKFLHVSSASMDYTEVGSGHEFLRMAAGFAVQRDTEKAIKEKLAQAVPGRKHRLLNGGPGDWVKGDIVEMMPQVGLGGEGSHGVFRKGQNGPFYWVNLAHVEPLPEDDKVKPGPWLEAAEKKTLADLRSEVSDFLNSSLNSFLPFGFFDPLADKGPDLSDVLQRLETLEAKALVDDISRASADTIETTYDGEVFRIPRSELRSWLVYMQDLSIFQRDSGNLLAAFSDKFDKYLV